MQQILGVHFSVLQYTCIMEIGSNVEYDLFRIFFHYVCFYFTFTSFRGFRLIYLMFLISLSISQRAHLSVSISEECWNGIHLTFPNVISSAKLKDLAKKRLYFSCTCLHFIKLKLLQRFRELRLSRGWNVDSEGCRGMSGVDVSCLTTRRLWYGAPRGV